MKAIFQIKAILLLFILSSCGPSAEERAAIQQRHDDSVKNVAVRETQKKMENLQEIKDKLEGLNKRTVTYKSELANLKADLDVANDKLKHIKEFHMLRTDSDREQQIRNQDLVIQSIEENIQKYTSAIAECEQLIPQLQQQLRNQQ